MLFNMLNQIWQHMHSEWRTAWSIQVLSRYSLPPTSTSTTTTHPIPHWYLMLLTHRLTYSVLGTWTGPVTQRRTYCRSRATRSMVSGRAAGGLKIKAPVQESIKTDLKILRPQISNLRRAAKPVNAQRWRRNTERQSTLLPTMSYNIETEGMKCVSTSSLQCLLDSIFILETSPQLYKSLSLTSSSFDLKKPMICSVRPTNN